MTGAGQAVVLGVGNILFRDDGIGVRMVEEMRRLADADPLSVPPGTRLVDGGTLGLDLLDVLAGARSLLLLDAVNLDQEIGAISVLRGDAILAAGGRGSVSTAEGLGELLATARLMGWLPDPVALVGVQVGDTRLGVGLSPCVMTAVAGAVETARGELWALDDLVAAGRSETPAIRRQGGAAA